MARPPEVTITNLRKPWEFITTTEYGKEHTLAGLVGYVDYSVGYYEPYYDEYYRVVDGTVLMTKQY